MMATKANKTPTAKIALAPKPKPKDTKTPKEGYHQHLEIAENPRALLRLETVCDLVGLAPKTIAKYRRQGLFPERHKPELGGPVRFLAADIYAWIEGTWKPRGKPGDQ